MVSKYLNEELPAWALRLLDEALQTNPARMSVISRIELLVYKPLLYSREQGIQQFVSESDVFDLTEPIIQQTVRLRRHYKNVKLPDAVIAATAIINGFTLLSTNDRDFERVQELAYQSLN
ncbi:MAG: type II toxin-antitoxin system VapC family toxin [Spirosoma sp.]|nr:type II toxin-antitoxin system VapC family toxin [Spirosoma sp.]